MDNEIWKDVCGYEGKYQVSNMGRVKSLERVDSLGRRVNERILRPSKDGNGYPQVGLVKEGERKWYCVHRLVLMTFSPIANMSKLLVNHKDENKLNNRLENLEWCTSLYNNTYNDRHKRVAEKESIPIVQLTLDGKYIRSWKSSHDAERIEGGFTQQNINACCKGKRKSHKGYRFMYLSEYMDKYNGIID